MLTRLLARKQYSGLETNGIAAKILYVIQEPRFVQPTEPLLKIAKSRIMLYLFFQVFVITVTVSMSQTIAAIGKHSPT